MSRLLQIATAARTGWKPINYTKRVLELHVMNKLTDRELVCLARQGCQKAFTLLSERYSRGLLAHIAEYLSGNNANSTEMAEEPQDICQEAFHKAFTHINDYNPQYEFSTWLYNIGKNTAIDYSRKRKISKKTPL